MNDTTSCSCSSAAVQATPLAKSIPFTRVPLVDFAGFREGAAYDKERVAREIGRALSDVGFFYLANHGIPQEDIDGVFAASRQFFAQPHALKETVSSENTKNHRGYFPIGGENVDPAHTRDLKEGFRHRVRRNPGAGTP